MRRIGPLRGALSLVLDIGLLIALLAIFYAAAAGRLRWATPLFTLSLTRVDSPLRIGLALLAIKTVLGLHEGLYAILARRSIPLLSPVSRRLHSAELGLGRLYLRHRLNLALSLAVSLVLLGALEIYLRSFPHQLPYALGNYIATGYDARPSGIYRFNPQMKMSFMRPNYERRMYFNGYYWTHRTDSLGFRNPEDRESAYVVLLGDSMIYGHGLEEHSTVRYHLETLLKKPVANLAAQGNSIHQEYQVLKTFGLRLKPASVFPFFLANDITDLTVFLTDDDMRRFLSIPVADHTTPYFEIKPVRQRTQGLASFLDDLYVRKAYQFLKKALRSGGRARAEAFAAEWESLPPFQGNPRMTLAMQFHLQALRKIQHLADVNNFRFTNVFIYTGYVQEEPLYEGILQSFCKTQGIRFVSLRDEIERALKRGEQVFLPGDGHFSDGGSRLVARVIAEQIRKSPPR